MTVTAGRLASVVPYVGSDGLEHYGSSSTTGYTTIQAEKLAFLQLLPEIPLHMRAHNKFNRLFSEIFYTFSSFLYFIERILSVFQLIQ